ncbi:hypothetical protein CONLIGDRAFT_627003 [Coniochaeta ligniaria NRRL 30616]|uniref:Uncharacterized protein n=1 Tax=Coniochaeta ligniaria NRRL 30616 TaxID=1408157 RepID=A0A1J7J665_9PEZI|nr:hypothetical protein CONLIGDRAFT_627003 [Coniochaeta ligniaria NRRL 30616]
MSPALEADPSHSGADLMELGHVPVRLVKTTWGTLLPKSAQAIEMLRMHDIPFIIKTNASNAFNEEAQAQNLLFLFGQVSPPVTALDERIIRTLFPFYPLVRRYADKTVLVIACDPVSACQFAWEAGLKKIRVHTDPDIDKAIRLGEIAAILLFSPPCRETLEGQLDLIARVLEYNRESKVIFCNRDYDRVVGFNVDSVTFNPTVFLEMTDRYVQKRLGTVPKYVLESGDPWEDHPFEDPPHGFSDICQAYRHEQFEEELEDVHRLIDDRQIELEKQLFPGARDPAPLHLDTIYFITNSPRGHYQELCRTQQSTIGATCNVMVVHDTEARQPYMVPRPWDEHVPTMVYEDVMQAITSALAKEKFPIHKANINGARRG